MPSSRPVSLTGFGFLGTSHQKITERTVEELDAEFFGITRLTKPMKKAIEQIADGNIKVDKDQTTSAKHFDGENFAGGQVFITRDNRPRIQPALENNDAATARFHLGQALHTIQDFYAHSDWVELGGGPHPSVGVPGATIGPAAGPTETTCGTCTVLPLPICSNCSGELLTSRLTSGYYAGEDRIKPGPFKCSHGGPFDGSVTGAGLGINKDSSDCAFSPRYDLHGSAVASAGEATKKFIRELKADLTQKQLKLLFGVGPNLAMAIDTTGSMGPIIAGVRQAAINIVDARLGTDEEPSKYVLVPFNDPFVGPTTVTTEPDVFKSGIGALGASGGGDCPELSMTGMLQALSSSDEGGDLFMFTDASSKDGGLAGAVASLATSKEIKVFPITFGSCSPLDPGYTRIAEQSGGQVFQIFPSEAGVVTQLADFLVRSNAVNMASISIPLVPGTPRTLAVPIDSTLGRVTFSVSGTTGVTLTRPDGTTVAAGQPGVSVVPLSSGAIYSITSPAAGPWSVRLEGSSPVSMQVTGESALDLSSFRFVEGGGRPGHEGFFPIAGLPVSGELNMAVAVMSGEFASVGFELRARDGSLLQTLGLVHGPGQDANEFSGELLLPNTDFLVYATGTDTGGQPFQRLMASSVRPQPVKIVPPDARTLFPGTTVAYTFTVVNAGASDSFSFRASDDRRWVVGVTPSVFTLAGGSSVEVTVQLAVPPGALSGTPDTLTATVESTADSNVRNFAVVTSTVGEEGDTTTPSISAVTPSPSVLWPPNHKMRGATVAVAVTDDQDPNPSCQISAVSSNEPVNGTGDGDTAPDWQVGPRPLELSLRAERSGGGTGRVYTIEVTCSDVSGNSSQAAGTVSVPHDQGH